MHKKLRVTLYHRKTKGAVKVWTCSVVGEEVWSTWGQKGGEMNQTQERPGANRDGSARQRAIELFTKKVERKKKKGYVEDLDDVVSDVRVDDDTLDFDRLPKSFAPAKPIKTIDLDTARQWDAQGLLFKQRKRDGMRHYLVSDSKGRLRIYSSGKDDMTEHLQPLIKDLEIPARTILDVELVVTEPGKKERDGFLIVSGIARSLPERARQQIRLAEGMGARVQLFAFDLLWWQGVPVYQKKYEYRYMKLQDVVDIALDSLESSTLEGYPPLVRMPLVSISPTRSATLDEARAMVKKHGWEGLVLWRKDQATVVQVNGTPKRINCYKDKPVGEEDVIAYGYELGKGKNRDVVGKFEIGYAMDAGSAGWKIKEMGRCGTGLDDATRKAALKWEYPCVIQIEYDSKSDKGFRFPVFIRKRDDKTPSECVR